MEPVAAAVYGGDMVVATIATVVTVVMVAKIAGVATHGGWRL